MSGDGGAASGSVREERARPRRVESHEHGVETVPPTRVRVTSRHNQSVRLKCVALRTPARTVLSRGRWSKRASVHARRGRGTLRTGRDRARVCRVHSAVSVCTERTDTESENGRNRTFCFKSLTQPEPVYRPRASSARCACQYTPKACTLTIISWYLRGPVARAGALVAGEAVHMSREACVGSEGGSSKIATSKVLRSARDP